MNEPPYRVSALARAAAGVLLLLGSAACGDPRPPPHVVKFVGLSDEQRRTADSLADELKSRFMAVPDTFAMNPQGLRVTFVHAPFAPYVEPGCRDSHSSALPAQPVARAIWDAMGAGRGIRRITLVARSQPQEHGTWFSSVSCGGGAAEFSFYPRDFAPPR